MSNIDSFEAVMASQFAPDDWYHLDCHNLFTGIEPRSQLGEFTLDLVRTLSDASDAVKDYLELVEIDNDNEGEDKDEDKLVAAACLQDDAVFTRLLQEEDYVNERFSILREVSWKIDEQLRGEAGRTSIITVDMHKDAVQAACLTAVKKEAMAGMHSRVNEQAELLQFIGTVAYLFREESELHLSAQESTPMG